MVQGGTVSKTPIPLPLRPALAQVVDRVAAGDFEALKASGADPYPDSDLGLWIREYGRPSESTEQGGATLISLPDEAWEYAEVIYEDPGPPRRWGVVIDLWTVEEGRSDLSMEADVVETSTGLRVLILNIHVM